MATKDEGAAPAAKEKPANRKGPPANKAQPGAPENKGGAAEQKRETDNVVALGLVPAFLDRIAESKGDLDDARMSHASIYKEADDKGLHLRALKAVSRLRGMDSVKAQAEIGKLIDYLRQAGILSMTYPLPEDYFVQRSLPLATKPAA